MTCRRSRFGIADALDVLIPQLPLVIAQINAVHAFPINL